MLVRQDRTASLRFATDRFTVADLVGKAVILHAAAVNLGEPPHRKLADEYAVSSEVATAKAAATGNVGDGMACGLIIRP